MKASDLPSTLPSWPTRAFPQDTVQAVGRLTERVREAVSSAGAVRSPCQGRVLETVLLLRLLERGALMPGLRSELRAHLIARRQADDPLERLLLSAALRPADAPREPPVDEMLRRVPAFTGTRKRLLVDAAFALCSVPLADDRPKAADFTTTGLHPWAAVQITAVKVIMAHMTGRTGMVRPGDVELLLSTQRTPWVWEGNVLLHLLVLHALVYLDDTSSIVEAGAYKTLSHRRHDGLVPFVSDVDTWCTATGGVALLAAGAPAAAMRPLADHLVGQQRPNGGWACTDRALVTDVDDTAVAVEFLHGLDPVGYADPVAAASGWLTATRHREGGFPTYVAEAPPEACMTAAAVNALSTAPERNRDLLHQGLDFLARRQRADGTFGPDWSASRYHTVFRSVLTAQVPSLRSRGGAARRITERALDAVRKGQNPDGGWGQQPGEPSDAISTAYSLIALCAQHDAAPVARGVRFLLSCRDSTGHVASIPDSIGPRPFTFTVPVLADVFALLALGHVSRRLDLSAGRTHGIRHRVPDPAGS